ncbi:hypothetical protein QQS21_008983 [Conoideocrella luteorostrata]|uniref:DNA replication factor Cdt1 C-terminal domain-containing protein n=1 Tax=Conoideocrella luteorostrata TaxID=1105319 RepID=A0AAJ0CM67_9HYPO|nr:hypothetical protein QQS21_008983 [Conoideocrella luteorostrata]
MSRPAFKRRQAAEVVPSSNSMTNFTRISKTHTISDASAKKSIVVELPAPSASRKRKATSIERETSTARSTRRTISFSPSSDDEGQRESASSKRPRRSGPSHPAAAAAAAAAVTVQVAKPPTKGKAIQVAKAASSRTRGPHRPSQSTIITKSVQQQKNAQTKIDAVYKKKTEKAKNKAEDKTLPPHLAELIALNKAFLKTVMIHIAHNGSISPIDIRVISPNISRAWGKRQVTVEDIRRCIAIQSCGQGHSASPFIISDYGRGRLCVEVAQGVDGVSIDEARLCRQFKDNIRVFCAERAMDQMTDVDVSLESLTLSDLPQAAIKEMGNGAKTNHILAKGQKALSELKSDIATKQQSNLEKQQAVSNLPMLNPDGSKMGLLDRIRHKQLAKANEPLPPSGPELQRRAALNRVNDVAATISMLSLSNPMSLPRQAFTMMVISEKLKDSLRVPISKEEGMACVRLIATEIAPEWLRIVPIGGRENVVIQRHSQPIDRVINERVQKLLTA